MPTIRIPGPADVPGVGVTRDPGVSGATPDAFGAGVGKELANFGEMAQRIGAHLYRERQASTDKVAVDTEELEREPRLRAAWYEAQKEAPLGGAPFHAALQKRIDEAEQQTDEVLRSRGFTPSQKVQTAITSKRLDSRKTYLTSGVTWEHNTAVTALETQTSQNLDAVAAMAQSGDLDADAALARADEILKDKQGLFGAQRYEALRSAKREAIGKAAIAGLTEAGREDEARELNTRLFGAVPRASSFGRRLPPMIGSIVEQEARAQGVDPALARTIAGIESGGRVNAQTGSYKGLFQLSDEGFAKFGGQGSIFDPQQNARAGIASLKADMAAFREKYGRDPSATELYLSHQQGQAGLAAHLKAPDRPAWQSMLSTGEGRQKGEAWAKAAIWGNVPDDVKRQFGSVENISSGQFVEIWRRKVEGGVGDQRYASAGPLMPNAEQARFWSNKIDQKQTQRETKLDIETTERLERKILDAGAGKMPLLPRSEIENDPDLSEPRRNALLRMHAAATTDDSIFENAVVKLNTKGAVWNPLDDTDKKGLEAVDTRTGIVAGVQQSDPEAAAVATHRFADTGMLSKGVKGSLEGMIRGGDDKQLGYAMSTLDAMYRKNPKAFSEAFDKDIAKTLAAWQSSANEPPGAFRERLRRANDPSAVKAREKAEEEGRKIVGDMSDKDVLSALDESWFSDPQKPMGSRDAPGMAVYREQYAALYAEGYATFDANKDAAKKFADDRIKLTWAISPAGGGRVMMHAPETLPAAVFPEVGGSRDWMREQVEAEVAKSVGYENFGLNLASVERGLPAYGLVTLPGTIAEIEAIKSGRKLPNDRQSPAWMLVYVDPDTQLPRQKMFYFDVAAAVAEKDKRRGELDVKHRLTVEAQEAGKPYTSSTMMGTP